MDKFEADMVEMLEQRKAEAVVAVEHSSGHISYFRKGDPVTLTPGCTVKGMNGHKAEQMENGNIKISGPRFMYN